MKLKYCGPRVVLYIDTARGHPLTTASATREEHRWYSSDPQEIASCCYPEPQHRSLSPRVTDDSFSQQSLQGQWVGRSTCPVLVKNVLRECQTDSPKSPRTWHLEISNYFVKQKMQFLYIYIYISLHIYVISLYISLYIHTHMYMCVHLNKHMCTYMHIYTHTYTLQHTESVLNYILIKHTQILHSIF